jgi:hypothetical protein
MNTKNEPAKPAVLACVALLMAWAFAGCSDGHYDSEVGPVRPVDPAAPRFLAQFEGVWAGSTWGTVIMVVSDKKLLAYMPNDPSNYFVVMEPFGTVDSDKHLVSVTLIRKHIPKEQCTTGEVTKWVDQLPKSYVGKTAEFISLHEADLEKWIGEQSVKYYELLPTLNSNGAAATGEPELHDVIRRAEEYKNTCEVIADSRENATLKDASKTAGTVEPVLTTDFADNQNFGFIRKLDDADRKLVAEKADIAAVDKRVAQSAAAISIVEAKLTDLNLLLNAVELKNGEVTSWLNPYTEACLKNHPPGSGHTADLLHAAGEISGFDWRSAREIVRLCSGRNGGSR